MDVYGAPRATQGSPTSTHAFVGGLGHPTEDDTGLIYMRARCMDPVTGPFVSEDPAEDGLSWFVYSAGDPVNGADAGGQKRLGIAFLLWFVAERLNANGWLAEDVGKLVTAGAEGAAVAVAWMEFVASMGTLLTLTRIGTKAHPLEAFKEAAYAAACAGALGVVTVSMAHQLELLWVMFNSNPDAPNDPQAVITRE
jgi:RHS repeat-associated protein